jgi:undecaprenyl-diphosphatase
VSLLEAIVLGIVQGLTEFLPVSSTAHLRIVPALFGWEDPGAAFTAVTQLGTMVAVLLYFRTELWRIARSWLTSLLPGRPADFDARMGWYLVVGTVPIVVFGYLFRRQIETGARSLYLIGTTLIVLGLLLLLAERVATHRRPLESVRTREGVLVGLAQAAALVPGVSRSGATITAGLFLGLERSAAARFSFLLSVPAVVLSGLFQLFELMRDGFADSGGAVSLIVATALAFVVGYASIAFLLRWLATHTTAIFVAYRVILGAAVLVLAATGLIN